MMMKTCLLFFLMVFTAHGLSDIRDEYSVKFSAENMEKVNNENLKYTLQQLETASDEFELVRNFYNITSAKGHKFSDGIELLKIYKVIEQHATETNKSKNNNLMLFHGTNQKGVAGILRDGFKNSVKSHFGSGVYMTESSSIASFHATKTNGKENHFGYVFVNEVLESEKLQKVVTTYETLSKKQESQYTSTDIGFTKYMYEAVEETIEYKKDMNGRRYRNNEVVTNRKKCDEFVADKKLVIPRYMILVKDEFRLLNNLRISPTTFTFTKHKDF